MKTGILLVFILAFTIVSGIAQTRVVTGTVISSEDGLPIPGVSVMAKNTTIGTVSDKNGNFSVAVPQAAQTLVFSFIGMNTQEVSVINQYNLTVKINPGQLQV